MQLKAERRSARGLSVLGAYTWSHSISNADISSVGGGQFLAAIQDYMDLRGSRSDSVFDIRHRLSIAAIYDVPLFRDSSRPLVRTLLGGWQLGTIITAQTGFAAALAGVVDTTGTGVVSRPDVVPGQDPMLAPRRTNAGAVVQHGGLRATSTGQLWNVVSTSDSLAGTESGGCFRHEELPLRGNASTAVSRGVL